MKGDPLLWIAGIAIIGLPLVLTASAVLRTRKPLERDRINHIVDDAAKKDKNDKT